MDMAGSQPLVSLSDHDTKCALTTCITWSRGQSLGYGVGQSLDYIVGQGVDYIVGQSVDYIVGQGLAWQDHGPGI